MDVNLKYEVENKVESQKITEIIDEYNENQETYSDLCKAIIFLLKKILKENLFKYQMVTSRVKDLKSIIEKLNGNKNVANIEKLSQLDDVSGCRIIFYLDSELERFVHYIYEEFEVIKDNLRYSNEDYNAHHLVVKFKPDRLKLTEYKQFKGLVCELQLTTVLFHAWSEVSHNITYKIPDNLKEFDTDEVEIIKKQLKDIMKNLIMPANYKFEYLNKEYEKLQKGAKILNNEFLHSVLRLNNRNDLYEALSLLFQYISRYGNKFSPEQRLPDFIPSIIKMSKKLKNNNLGKFGFKCEHHHVVEECIKILHLIRYQYPNEVFLLLVDLALDKNTNIKREAENSLKYMTKYNYPTIQRIGLSLQYLILEEIKQWGKVKQIKSISVIKAILSEILKLEYEHTSMEGYKTVNIDVGLLHAGESIKELRQQAITLLMTLFQNAKQSKDQLTILETINVATVLPNRGIYNNEIDKLVLDNTRFIIVWYKSIVDNEDVPLEIIKEIDKQLKWIKRRHIRSDIKEFTELEQEIRGNKNYIIYRVLVGFDHDYKENIDWREARDVRNGKVKEYVEQINPSCQDFWLWLIQNIVKGFRLEKQGEYTYFNSFLYTLALKKPSFAKILIEKYEGLFQNMHYHLLAGLWESDNIYARSKVNGWIESGKFLLDCVDVFLYLESLEVSILDDISKKALKEKNTLVLNEIVRLSTSSKSSNLPITNVFLKTINALSTLNNYSWTNYIWFDESGFVDSLVASEQDEILDALNNCPYIDSHVEHLLIPIAKSEPKKLIEFLEKRVQIQNRKKKYWTNKYEAIPYRFTYLNKNLRENEDEYIPLILSWYKKQHFSYHWKASDILKNMFPEFKGPLEKYLLKILSRKNRDDAKIMLQVLKEYNGDSATHAFCKEFIITYNDQPDLWKQLMHVLSGTDVVTGEYGFVDAYVFKKKVIRKWNKTKNAHIKAFVKEYVDYLNSIIVSDTKRTDKRIELMKLEFETN